MSRESVLGEMAWEKWWSDNINQGRHAERFDKETLERLMISRLSKMANEVKAGDREPLGRVPRISDVDDVFQDILNAGLLQEVNPKVVSKEEQEAAAKNAEMDDRTTFHLHMLRFEKQRGHSAVREWLNTKANAEQKKLYAEIFGTGVITPESAAQDSNLFFVRATFPDGRVKFVSGHHIPVPLDSTARYGFGWTNAERFAELLRAERPELKRVEVISATEPERSKVSDESLNEYTWKFNKEMREREKLADRKRA